MINSNQEPIELFFQMEKIYNLYSIRSVDGLPVWDIVRNEVFQKINDPFLKSASVIRPSLRVKQITRRLFSILKILFVNGEVFFFGASRFYNEKGECYDPYFISIKDFLNSNYIFFESVLWRDKYIKHKRIFNFYTLYKFFGRHTRFYEKRNSLFNKDELNILSAIKQTFECANITHSDLENILWNFRIDFYFYRKLFKYKKIKKVFLHQNGFQKGLIKAAQVNSIPVYEFQHGDITDSSTGVNYGTLKVVLGENIIFPDVLLTFSEIWCNGKNIPAECIEIGSDFYHIEINIVSNFNSVVVISCVDHEQILEELTCQLSKMDSSITFYYKLHPSQFIDIKRHQRFFKDFSNVQVISEEMNMKDIIGLSNIFIAIYSTAMYEILQAGKILFVYKKDRYLGFKNYFYLPRVYLFDRAEDFPQMRKKAVLAFTQNDIPQFFKPFNMEAFITAYKKYSFPYMKSEDISNKKDKVFS